MTSSSKLSRNSRRSRHARSQPSDLGAHNPPSSVDKPAGPSGSSGSAPLHEERARRSSTNANNAANNAWPTDGGASPSEASVSPSPTGGWGSGDSSSTASATPTEGATTTAQNSQAPPTSTATPTPVTTTQPWVAPTTSAQAPPVAVASSSSPAPPPPQSTVVVTETLSSSTAVSALASGSSVAVSSVTLVSSTAILTSTLAPTTIAGIIFTPIHTSAVVTVVPSTIKPVSTVKATATGTLATQAADQNSHKLAAGAVAGIVVGCLLFLVAVYAFVAIWRRKREESSALQDEYGGGYEGTSADGMYEKTTHTSNLNRSGTTHSALSFSDDPVDRPPRSNGWHHNYTNDGASGSDGGTFLSVPYGAPSLPPVQREVYAQPQPPQPIPVKSRDSTYSANSEYSNLERHAYDGVSEDAHGVAPLEVRANDDIRLTQFDDWMQYENGLQPANPHSGSTEHIPAQDQVGVALSPPANHQGYDDIYETYAGEPKPSNGPWLRSTPVPVPVSPVQLVQPHYGEVSHA